MRSALALLLLSLTGCPEGTGSAAAPAAEVAAAGPFERRSPLTVTPPEGTKYPCAFTPLPVGLPGIPPQDARYIDHVYAAVLEAIHAKLELFRELRSGEPAVQRAGLVTYLEMTAAALAAIRAEAVPAGLEPFQADVIAAIDLQRTFFTQATEQLAGRAAELRQESDDVRQREWQVAWKAMFRIPEGKQASGKLIAAWRVMEQRYRGWPADTKGSVYHHLCALDLF